MNVFLSDEDCGIWHCCVLTEMGDVYTWGMNRDGQLGVGKQVLKSDTPQLVVFNDDEDIECVCMSSGGRHICVVDSEGYAWGWGWNKCGQVIADSVEQIWHPIKIVDECIESITCGHWYTLIQHRNNGDAAYSN